MENIDAVFETKKNVFGRDIQILKFNEADDKASRKMWINENEALQVLKNEFIFQNGKEYRVKYLISDGWRSGETFRKSNNTILENHVYSKEYEIVNYGGQALELIKIYGIEVSEVKPKENIEWADLLDD
jgi:hypothetical protein